jgi:hypothetical protein
VKVVKDWPVGYKWSRNNDDDDWSRKRWRGWMMWMWIGVAEKLRGRVMWDCLRVTKIRLERDSRLKKKPRIRICG